MKKLLSKYSFELLCLLLALVLLLSGCGTGSPSGTEPGGTILWEEITMEKAMELMNSEEGYLIVDVRRQDEYDAGHIPGAVLVTNEEIGTGEGTAVWTADGEEGTTIAALPDKEQLLLVYCRSGNRSKQASQKLADLGYIRVKEFGGIQDWPGEIEY